MNYLVALKKLFFVNTKKNEEAESDDGVNDTRTDYTDDCSSSATWKYGDNKYDTDYDTCEDTEEK